MRSIKVCAGIGDNVWLLQKLINSGERFNFQLPDGKPQRGHQVFEILPQVAASVEYVKGLSYKTLSQRTHRGVWSKAPQNMFLSCNEWLERGKMLKDWMPDLKLSYKLPWFETKVNIPKGRYIGIYGSAYSTQRAWKQYGAWGVTEWLELIELIHRRDPAYVFVIVGAEWDTDFATEVVTYLTDHKITFINTIGEPLTTFVQWCKAFHYAFYFPSGLPILSETVTGSSDCCMFYTTNISGIAGTWADPVRIEAGNFKECIFCEPQRIFDWCVDNYKI